MYERGFVSADLFVDARSEDSGSTSKTCTHILVQGVNVLSCHWLFTAVFPSFGGYSGVPAVTIYSVLVQVVLPAGILRYVSYFCLKYDG